MIYLKKIWKKWSTTIIGGLLLFGITLFLRIYNLTDLPVFADEAIYIRWAQIMRAEPTLRFVPLSDGKQPLFMWVVIPFLKLFSDPLIAGRFVSVFCGIGTIVGIFTASYLLFNSQKISLVACIIYALSPFSLFFDRMALVDSMLTMFGIWFFIFALLTFRFKRFDYAMLSGFVLGGALLTKSPALFFSLFLPTTWFLSNWPKTKAEKIKNILIFILLSAIIYLIGYAIYNILRLGPNFHLLKLRNMDYVYPIKHILESPLDPFKGHFLGIVDYFIKLGPNLLIILIIIGSYFGLKKYPKYTLILLIWGFLPVLTEAEYAKGLTARYILFSLPFLFIVASLALQAVKLPKKIVSAIFVIFIFQSLFQSKLILTDIQAANLPQGERSGYLEEWTAGYGIREISEYIKAEKIKESKQQYVIGTEGYFGTLPDGLLIYLNNTKDVIVVGVGLGFTKVPDSLIESKQAGNRTFLVVNSTRMTIQNPETKKLELIASYPKALRKVGSREYNLYGPQESLLLFELK